MMICRNVGFMSSNIRFGSSKEITPGPAHYVNMQSHQLSVRSPTLPKMNSSFSSRVIVYIYIVSTRWGGLVL